MTLEEFAKWEKLCKDSWEELAKTGSGDKPDELSGFENMCPACEIAVRVSKNKREENLFDVPNCEYCPIDIWRSLAFVGSDPYEEGAVCDYEGQLYCKWREALMDTDTKSVVRIAKKISKLKWTYLSEYKSISGKFPK